MTSTRTDGAGAAFLLEAVVRNRLSRCGLLSGLVRLTGRGVGEGGQRSPDEPRQPLQELIRTEVVYPQKRGEFQLTVGSTADTARHGVLAFPLGIEFGPYARVRADDAVTSGRGPLSVGSNYRFMHIGGSDVHAAVGLDFEFRGGLGADVFTETTHAAEPFVVLAVDRRARFQMFFNAGRSWTVRGDGRDEGDQASLSAANIRWNAGGLVSLHAITLALELNARTSGSPWRSGGERYATSSITLLLARPWEAGVGVSKGLGGRSDRFGVAAHVIYEK